MGDFHEPDLTTTPRLHLRSMDDAGTLYGTANNAGDIDCGCGVVFKLTAKGKQTALHVFTGGGNGGNSKCRLVIDAGGNFYGTTAGGGIESDGTVFELTAGQK